MVKLFSFSFGVGLTFRAPWRKRERLGVVKHDRKRRSLFFRKGKDSELILYLPLSFMILV